MPEKSQSLCRWHFSFSRIKPKSQPLDAEAEINARLLSQVIEAPEMWHFDDLKLEEFLRRRSEHGQPETRRIFDTQRNLIAQSVDAIDQPRITRSVDT